MSDEPIQRPTSRYGRARLPGRASRRAVVVLAVAAVAVGTLVAAVAYQRWNRADVKGTLAGYELIDDQTVAVTISVTRTDPSRPVVCIVRVRATDGSESGRREVLVGPSDAGTVRVTAVVKSSKPAKLGDIYGCGADVPGYLHSP